MCSRILPAKREPQNLGQARESSSSSVTGYRTLQHSTDLPLFKVFFLLRTEERTDTIREGNGLPV